jgi:branched-subunit amino acid transport protein
MTLFLGLLAAVLVTWLARVSFIALVPADRLPADLPRMLGATTPAVFGALTVVTVLRSDLAATAGVASMVLPLAVAALLAYRRANLAVIVLAAIVTATGLRILGW